MTRRSKIRRRSKSRGLRRRRMRGGSVSLEFDKPAVNATSSSQAIQGAMHKQKAQNALKSNDF